MVMPAMPAGTAHRSVLIVADGFSVSDKIGFDRKTLCHIALLKYTDRIKHRVP